MRSRMKYVILKCFCGVFLAWALKCWMFGILLVYLLFGLFASCFLSEKMLWNGYFKKAFARYFEAYEGILYRVQMRVFFYHTLPIVFVLESAILFLFNTVVFISRIVPIDVLTAMSIREILKIVLIFWMEESNTCYFNTNVRLNISNTFIFSGKLQAVAVRLHICFKSLPIPRGSIPMYTRIVSWNPPNPFARISLCNIHIAVYVVTWASTNRDK